MPLVSPALLPTRRGGWHAAAGAERRAGDLQVSLQQQVAQQEGLTQAGRVHQLEAAVRAVEQSRTKEVARPRRGRRRVA
jgi:hypothetical protein